MTVQINLRLPEKMFVSARDYATSKGFANVQDFIRETVRQRLYEPDILTEEEMRLVKRLASVSERRKLYGTEGELLKKLRQ